MVTAREYLMHSRCAERLYAIGVTESRVTLYSQQVRALNTVYALLAEGALQPGQSVAVIGGGPAGMTAAAAAALKGCHATLIERRADLIPLLRGNHTRWLHPHIYDWPHDRSKDPVAGLPVLNWSAGTADQVAEQITNAWEALPSNVRALLTIDRRAAVEACSPEGDRLRLVWNTPEGSRNRPFSIVLLAVGFGVEEGSSHLPATSYWRNDDLDQPLLAFRGRPLRILVSGCGDGGLVDVLRARLIRFRHDQIVDNFLSERVRVNLKDILLDAEREAKSKGGASLVDRYDALEVAELDSLLKSRLRSDTDVTMSGTTAYPFSLNSSILNRFLVSRLLKFGNVKYLPRATESCLVRPGPPGETPFQYEVAFSGGPRAKIFDRVVVRHGPRPALESIAHAFPGLNSEIERLRVLNSLDQTRERLWPGDFFGSTVPVTNTVIADAFWIEFRHPALPPDRYEFHVKDTLTFNELTDAVYFRAGERLQPYTYGATWVLRDAKTNRPLRHMRMIRKIEPGSFVIDDRSLDEVGIEPGMLLYVGPAPSAE
jgi:hypothetical protein